MALTVTPASADEVHVFSTSFGEPGSGNGQLALAERSGLAVNQTSHDVYVADTGNGRVEEFSAAGVFVRAFGTLEHPTFVAIDNSGGPSQGDVYVADSGNNSVAKFQANGTAVSSWGTAGKLTGFPELKGIAVDQGGDLFVLENSSVQWFNPDGTTHSSPFTPPRESSPRGLVIDSEGHLYKIDGNPEVQKFTNTGENLGEPDLRNDAVGLSIDPFDDSLYVVQSGEGGFVNRFALNCGQGCEPVEEFGSGSLSNPQSVALDAISHHAYVANAGTSEISVFGTEYVPAPLAFINVPTNVAYSTAQVSGTVNPESHTTTCRFEYVTAQHFEAEGFTGANSQSCAANPGSGSAGVSVEADLSGLATATSYRVRLVAKSQGGTSHSAEPNPTFETKAVAAPTVSIEPVTTFTGTTAHFSGHINPNAPGPAPQDPAFNVAWSFECTPSCGPLTGELEGDDSSHEVSADASELLPGTEYTVNLIAKNAGLQALAGPVTFATPAVAPTVSSTSVITATTTEAALSAQINPGGAATTYHFEYITEQQFQADGEDFGVDTFSTPESASIGSDNEAHEAMTAITGLTPGTNYRFRVVAHNSADTTIGPTQLLSTYPAGPASSGCENEALRQENNSLALPDCRAYEQVSAPDNAEVFSPTGVGATENALAITPRFMQASPDGGTVIYVAEPPSSGEGGGTGSTGSFFGDDYRAVRSSGGWTTTDIQPLGSEPSTDYSFFSKDLSLGIVSTPLSTPLNSQSVTCSFAGQDNILYSGRDPDGGFQTIAACGVPFFVGSSADSSHLFFESKGALTPGAEQSPPTVRDFQQDGHANIYDSFTGQLHLVNVLPGPEPEAAPSSTIGALPEEEPLTTDAGARPALNTDHAISADGSRVFWTDLSTEESPENPYGVTRLFVRENPSQPQSAFGAEGECTDAAKACTVQIDAAEVPEGEGAEERELREYNSGRGRFWTASSDGSKVYFTTNRPLTAEAQEESGQNLYEYDFNKPLGERLTDLTVAGSAGVLGVIGVNETGPAGSYLYFVAEGALAPGAETRSCEAASPTSPERREEQDGKAPLGRGCNLYLIDHGATTLVATLLISDNNLVGPASGLGGYPRIGDWAPVLGYRAAQLTPDGTNLVFTSYRRLTPYDNVSPASSCGGRACPEIYHYDAASAQISCASCNPSGERPAAQGYPQTGSYLPFVQDGNINTRRWLSDDGSRLFFDSIEALTPSDKNQRYDVYEWERDGVPGCAGGSSFNNGGCVYLISGGIGSQGSFLVDASASGANVFFTSRAQLAPSDRDAKPDLYDARVGGGFTTPAEAQICTSREACQATSGPQPSTQSAGSATFEANEPPVKCRSGKIKKHGKCVKKRRHRHKHYHQAGRDEKGQK